MGLTVKGNKVEPLNILIDFFASIYDLVYDAILLILNPLVKLGSKIKQASPLEMVIDFFAFQYDVVYAFIFFLGQYLKWATNMRSYRSAEIDTPVEKPIVVAPQIPLEIL
ncbi:hypothetical protein [Flavobacterium sp. N3904]|uniref:hypothetical protein n=1 Tax=Flavobacterium sp. N3904 TaxID=2986835 RepID=UPI00222520DB|nr:hypothetical protein [Flavobacterium sp. N3904]